MSSQLFKGRCMRSSLGLPPEPQTILAVGSGSCGMPRRRFDDSTSGSSSPSSSSNSDSSSSDESARETRHAKRARKPEKARPPAQPEDSRIQDNPGHPQVNDAVVVPEALSSLIQRTLGQGVKQTTSETREQVMRIKIYLKNSVMHQHLGMRRPGNGASRRRRESKGERLDREKSRNRV
ncbi:hypothetical protein DAPPUDRAFT_270455 [Daphnia pulex]|uniref:Uncharacterized protein n=1 Tax=Daphnia pulex TaxID=6669 RepID=E9I0R8_DAPPU|nr:hypothetical protein DAPPUDRAFT_270455 [Daphnia pulex]|eukprot:EFX62412.1 hypothetical protein DAPPUDRAFT_270455 [Daphnia pulex]